MPKIAYLDEVVKYTGLSRWAVGELTRKNLMPHFSVPQIRRHMYDLDKIDQWLQDLQDKPAQAQGCGKLRVMK
ncbi:MAG: hypothetical protein PHW73_06070 [Atribacterota bacterium]|nr:hypothetical protein [Atribacterota bacterium]